MTDNGPYETSDRVRHLPAVRAIYDVMRDTPRRGAGQDECEKLLTRACEEAGVTLGAYDARIVRWLANWEPETCMVFAGLIARAAQRPEGTVTEWAIAFTDWPGRETVQPYPDERTAREAVAQLRELAPEQNARVMSHEVGPWTQVPEEGEGDG